MISISGIQDNSSIPNAHKDMTQFWQRESLCLQSPSKGVSIGNLGLYPLGQEAEELTGKWSQMFTDWKVRRKHLGSFGADVDNHHA